MRAIWGNEPNWNEQLWRYFKPERFLWTIEKSKLYFASANEFADPFEGAVAVISPDFPVDPRYAEPERFERAFQELKLFTKLNCWHRADYESDAMWRLYAAQGKGLAICSTPERMRNAFPPFRLQRGQPRPDTMWAGEVRYADLLTVRLDVGMEERFFHKHLAFSWEQEFRLAISVRDAAEWGVEIPELGMEVPVDIKLLVDKIMLGPELAEEDRRKLMEHAEAAGLADRITKSSLCGRPRYL